MTSASAGVVVQRVLATKAKELEPFKTPKKFFGGGKSLTEEYFDSIYKSLKDYEKGDKAGTRSVLEILQRLERDIREFLKVNSNDNKYTRKRAILEPLLDEVNDELRAVGQMAGQERYAANVLASGLAPDRNSNDPGRRDAFEALTNVALSDVRSPEMTPKRRERIEALMKAYGITDEELMAIRIFTSADYGYINPAMAVDSERMDKNKKSEGLVGGSFLRGASDKTNMSEGAAHGAMMLSGVRKLPVYGGKIYRGQWVDEKDWQKIREGHFGYNSFASTSLSFEIASDWINRQAREYEKYRRIVFVISNSGGRDIAELSSKKAEKEVVLLPGTSYTVQAVDEQPGHEDVHRVWMTGNH